MKDNKEKLHIVFPDEEVEEEAIKKTRRKKITKQMLLDELWNMAQFAEKDADKISCIKQLALMQGYNEPIKTENVNKTFQLKF